jgi:hypothetical protein
MSVIQWSILFIMITGCTGISSPIQPFTTYKHSSELEKTIADLWWTIDDAKQEITFELHVKSTGWIALGISPGRKSSIRFQALVSLFSWWYERCGYCCWMGRVFW